MRIAVAVLLVAGGEIFVSGQCPKKDVKCTYPVLKEFDPSGRQLLGHASCIRKECPNVVEHDNGESRAVVLAIHNEYRRLIALGEDAHFKRRARSSQGAGNMLQVVWDDSLADNAIKWAFQLCMDRGRSVRERGVRCRCLPGLLAFGVGFNPLELLGLFVVAVAVAIALVVIVVAFLSPFPHVAGRPTGRLWRHDMLKCRSTDQFENVGQSLFWVHDAQGTMNWKHAIGSWFNQRFNIVEDQLFQPPGLHTNVTEFLQLIWADTFKARSPSIMITMRSCCTVMISFVR